MIDYKIKKIDRVFAVFAISRSGHHAITDWIYESLKKNKAFFNDSPLNQPIEKRRKFYLNNRKYYNFKNVKERIATFFASTEGPIQRLVYFRKNNWIPEVKNVFKKYSTFKNVILNFENYNLHTDCEKINHCIDKVSDNVGEKIAIVIIRNPFNLLASRIMYEKPITREEKISGKINLVKFLKLWKIYANFVLRKQQIYGFDKTIMIKYDDWFSSSKTKKNIAQKLHLDKTLLSFEKMSLFGGGSSFDKFRYQGKASKLKTHTRWHQLISSKNPEFNGKKKQFIDLFKKHPEIEKISTKIFGKTFNLKSIRNFK